MAKFTVFQITALVILLSFCCASVKAKPAPRDPNGPTYNPLGQLIQHPELEHRPEDSAGNEPTDTADELAQGAEATGETLESTNTTDEPTEATYETTQPSNTKDEPTEPANPEEPYDTNDEPTESNGTGNNEPTEPAEPTENPEESSVAFENSSKDSEESNEESEEPPQKPESKSSRSPALSQPDDNSLPTTKKPAKKLSTEDILNSKCSEGPGRNGKIICQSSA